MEPAGNWNIVVIGLWNENIFNIPWISAKLFGQGDVRGEFPILPGFPTKYSAEGVEILPNSSNLTIQASVASDGILRQVEEKAVTILSLLPETPVRAAGFNYTFAEKDPSDILQGLFELDDTEPLSDSGIVPTKTVISRQAPHDPGIINLLLARTQDGIQITVNFHRDVQNATEAAEFLRGNAVEFKNQAIQMLKAVYNLDLEEA